MTRGMHVVRAIGVAAVTLGLMAQAAQAVPEHRFGLPPAGPGTQPVAPSYRAPLTHRGPLGAAVAAAHRDSAPSRLGAVYRPPLVAQLRGGAPAPPAALPGPVGSSGDGVNWTAVAGGAALIVLLGALATLLFRQQPGRPATA